MGTTTAIEKLFLRHYPRIHARGGVDFNGDGKIVGPEKLDANGDGKYVEDEYWGLLKRGVVYVRKNMLMGAVPIIAKDVYDGDTANVAILNSIGTPAYRYMLNKLVDWRSANTYGETFKHVGDKAVPFLKGVAVQGRKTKMVKAAVHALEKIGSKTAANALVDVLIARAGDEWLEDSLDHAMSKLGAFTHQRLIPFVSNNNYLLSHKAYEILRRYLYAKTLPEAILSKIRAAIRLFRPIKVRVGRIRRVGRGWDGTPSYDVNLAFSSVPAGAKIVIPIIHIIPTQEHRQNAGTINKKMSATCRMWLAHIRSIVELRFYEGKRYLGKTTDYTIIKKP